MSTVSPQTVAATSPPALEPDWADAQEAGVLDGALDLIRAGGARWDRALFSRATQAVGLSPADAALLAPNGALDLAALLWRRHDQAALATLDRRGLPAKVRERIRLGAEVRVETAMADEAAVRAASLFLARPDHAPTALRLGWTTADGLWRWAGDVATDENHYSKRALLSVVLAGTLAVRLARGREAAQAHLRASIDRVMGLERFKARLAPTGGVLHMVAFSLGRLRYGPEPGEGLDRWSSGAP